MSLTGLRFAVATKRKLRVALGVLLMIASMLASEAVAHADCPSGAVRYSPSSIRIYITGPVTCTLTDLDAVVPSSSLESVSSTKKIWILRANIVLQKGATLLLHGGAVGGDVDELRLRSNDSSASGSVVYIRADWGNLDIDSTKVTSWDEAASGVDTRYSSNGRANIHVRSRLASDGTARESRMDIRSSDVGYLGHNAAESSGLTWNVYGTREGLFDKVNVYGDVIESRLHHNYVGADARGASGMTWSNNALDHNVKDGVRAQGSDDLVVADNDLSDNGAAGFSCARRCRGLDLRNNRSFNNVGNGFALNSGVSTTTLEENEASANGAAGVAIADSSGNVVRSNRLFENGRGLRLSLGSSGNLIERNTVEQNGDAFHLLKGSGQSTSGDGRVRKNQFRENTVRDNPVAIRLSRADENVFSDNVFSGTSGLEPFSFTDGARNLLEGNIIPPDALVHTKTADMSSASTLIERAGGDLLIRTSGGATTTFRETSDFTHYIPDSGLATRVTPTEGILALGRSAARTVRAAPIYGRPSSGVLLLTPTGSRTFRAVSEVGTLSAQFTVGELTPGTTYSVLRNGAAWGTATASSAGVLSFTDTVGTTSVSYSIVQG